MPSYGRPYAVVDSGSGTAAGEHSSRRCVRNVVVCSSPPPPPARVARARPVHRGSYHQKRNLRRSCFRCSIGLRLGRVRGCMNSFNQQSELE